MSERGRIFREWLVERFHREHGASTILGVLLQLGEMQKQLRCERSSRRCCIVRHFPRTRDQLLGVPRRIEEGSRCIVPKPFNSCVSDLSRETHPFLVEGQLVNREESECDGGMILEKAIDARHAFLMRAHHSSTLHHLPREELGIPDCELPEIISCKSARGSRDAAQHQAVPRRKNLLVSTRPHPF